MTRLLSRLGFYDVARRAHDGSPLRRPRSLRKTLFLRHRSRGSRTGSSRETDRSSFARLLPMRGNTPALRPIAGGDTGFVRPIAGGNTGFCAPYCRRQYGLLCALSPEAIRALCALSPEAIRAFVALSPEAIRALCALLPEAIRALFCEHSRNATSKYRRIQRAAYFWVCRSKVRLIQGRRACGSRSRNHSLMRPWGDGAPWRLSPGAEKKTAQPPSGCAVFRLVRFRSPGNGMRSCD